ncbi:MAG: carbohydrate ABC transporter permease [Treponema sp.]|jgi:ABC-type glycerol-3-phosphate transport system permease component|nr:carbohydrate ABC transporter permease [Treponema sp.]
MKHRLIRYTLGDKVFLFFDCLILTLFLIVLAYPLLYIISASFTAGVSVMSLSLIPQRVSLAGYEAVFQYGPIWTGYLNSLIYMAGGTLISLTLTVCCAYPLSRQDFKGRGLIMALCMITMYFSGGTIPTFLQVRNLGLLGSRLAVVLPGALSVYNMIVMRTYFKSQVPHEIFESAQMDGCGNIRYLLRILLPLSTPILAVTGLFYAVGFWNSYFDAMMYLANVRTKYPLSLILREILVLNEMSIDQLEVSQLLQIEERRNVMKYAVIIVASFPVMVIYPFVQKYFVKGIMIGAVKG